ncbi:hypothetical protein CSB37_00310 [bacterium DOLZORAL124_38_8]|nr:MAG: hypothetical protein CSB37_00310 [bacterium DOLZORAL124_38_8]
MGGISHIVIGLVSLFGSVIQGNYYIEETITLKPGVTTIETPAEWETVTLFSPDKKTVLPPIFWQNSAGAFYEWSTDNAHEDGLDGDWVLRPKVYDASQKKLVVYTETPVKVVGHFFNTQKPFGRLMASLHTPKINLGNFLFGDALLEGVDVKNFKNETELGGFANNFKPKFITRAGWGADETLRRWTWRSGISAWFRSSPPEAKYVKQSWKPVIVARKDAAGKKLTWPIEQNQIIKKIVLHHTGEYLDDRHQMRRNPKKHVRSIYYYHTVTRGWGDIGYNFLIDKRGNIYEGRAGGPKTVGAHAENYNVGTIGISLIGNFNIEQPTQEQVKVLSIFLAYLSDKYKIPVHGNSVFLGLKTDNITAHRFVTRPGKGTSCAGNNLVKLLPALRNKVAEIQVFLRKLRAQGKLTGRDFLGLAPEAQKYVASKKFVLPKRKALITPAELWEKQIVTDKTQKIIRLRVVNNSNFTWKAGSKLSVKSAPGGLEFDDFVIEADIVPYGTGYIRGGMKVTTLSSGDYAVELSPDFLSQHYFASQYSTARIIFSIKVVQNFSNLVSQLQANSLSRSLRSPIRQDTLSGFLSRYKKKLVATKSPVPVKPAVSPVSKVVTGVKRKQYAVMNTKIKLAGFQSLVAKVSANKTFRVLVRGSSVTVPAGETILVKQDKTKVTVQANGKTLVGSLVRLQNIQNGVFTIQNYANPRFGRGRIAYNRFRGDLVFYPHGERLMAVNELPIYQYLWGLGEEPKTEPEHKKHAIYVLARSYAVVYSKYRRKFGTSFYDLEDDPRTSQLYLGYDWEVRHPEQKRLINRTKGRVITYQGKPVIGPYFTQSNGQTSDKWQQQYPWTKAQALSFDRGLPQKGHGVGLSGNTARQLAKQGKNYKQILEYFFDNIGLKKVY